MGIRNLVFAFVLNVGKFEFFAQNPSQFIERHVHFEDMCARVASCFSVTRLRFIRRQRIPRIAVALPNPSPLFVPEAKTRNVDLRDRNRHDIFAFASNEFALRNVLAQILPNPAPYDLAKTPVVLINFQ